MAQKQYKLTRREINILLEVLEELLTYDTAFEIHHTVTGMVRRLRTKGTL